jgi:K+-sensing histidine kinase KdpD
MATLLRRGGVDVVVAYFEPHARPDTIGQAQGLEIVPHAKIEYRGKTFEEMDTEAVLRRRPSIALVDELAHTNIPGSVRTKRWEDVEFRELTLRQAAHEVDLRQSAYDETRAFQVPRISEARPSGAMDNQPKERILIHITADPSTAMLIRRGHRVADYLHADCIALFVHETPELSQLPAEERQLVEKHLRFARSLQIETRVLCGSDIAKTVVEFARRNQVTQIFVAHAQPSFRERLRGRNYAENIVRLAQDLQVTVVADRSRRLGS